MRILIPGALPPAPIAAELIAHFRSGCPTLCARLDHMAASAQALDPEQTGCTPLEAITLQQLGYAARAGYTLGAGLGPLRAGVADPGEPIWLAELSSVAVGSDGASMMHPDSLDVRPEEADALFESVSMLWDGSGISALPVGTRRWRIWLPADAQTPSISPNAVAGLALADWWPQGETMRSWRRLVNEIQMVWHDHPVNESRAQRGLVPVNSLWLYGGSPGWRANGTIAQGAPGTLILEDLAGAHAAEDWAQWIDALPRLSDALGQIAGDDIVTLLGTKRAVDLVPANLPWWRRLLPAHTQDWKSWWNLPG